MCAAGIIHDASLHEPTGVAWEPEEVFTQLTQCQNFDATSGMDWTIFFTLSIGRHVKCDARVTIVLTLASKRCLCEITQRALQRGVRVTHAV